MDTTKSLSTDATGPEPTTPTQSQGNDLESPEKIQSDDGSGSESSSPGSRVKLPRTGYGFEGTVRHWNIISAGPSMMLVKPVDLLDDAVTVAINRAISVRHRVPVDIWAVWDHPEKLFALGYDRHIHPPLTIWLGPNRFQEFYLAAIGKVPDPAWETFLHPKIGLRSMPFGYRETDTGRAKTVSTLCYAVEKAVMLGAKHVRIFGADMEGSWSEGKSEKECVAQFGDRWSWERSQMDQMLDAADESEVFVELL
jgi:hypothetical protein